MTNRIRMLRFILCYTGIMAILGARPTMAQSPVLLVPDTQTEGGTGPGEETDQLKTTRIQAVVKAVEDGKILVESQTEEPYPGEILLSTSVFDTRFVDGETGFQAEPSDLHAGDTIYADIRTVMAESLPPQVTAEIIICNMPESVSAPEYLLTESMEWQEDGSWRLVSSSGAVYQIPGDCPVISYGMNQLSSFRIISKSSKLLVWLDENNQPQRILKLPARW